MSPNVRSEIPDHIKAVLAGLEAAPDILAGLVRDLPEDKLQVRRGQGFWTLAEHLSHLAEVQAMLLGRIQRILDEDDPEFTPFIPAESADPLPKVVPVDQALAAFARGRAEQLKLLEAAGPGDWQRTARHPEFEAYGLAILARHMLMHDHWHMYRMEELWLTRDKYLTRLEG